MNQPFLLYLDRYHLSDSLFLQALARALAQRPPGPPFLLLHGPGETAERLLEARGYEPRRGSGVLEIRSGEEEALLERAVRETTRMISGILTDSVVHALPVMGGDRGLLTISEGEVRTGDTAWLQDLLESGVVPIISTLAIDPARRRYAEVRADAAATRLSFAIGASGVAFFARGGRIQAAGREEARGPRSIDSLSEDEIILEPDVTASVLHAGVAAFVVSPAVVGASEPSEWVPISL